MIKIVQVEIYSVYFKIIFKNTKGNESQRHKRSLKVQKCKNFNLKGSL